MRQHEHTVTVPAWRGTIYDTDGADLALGVQTTTVFADPTELRQPRAVAIAAGKLLGVDPNTLYPELLTRRRASSTSTASAIRPRRRSS